MSRGRRGKKRMYVSTVHILKAASFICTMLYV